jgi:hypothetical protein
MLQNVSFGDPPPEMTTVSCRGSSSQNLSIVNSTGEAEVSGVEGAAIEEAAPRALTGAFTVESKDTTSGDKFQAQNDRAQKKRAEKLT